MCDFPGTKKGHNCFDPDLPIKNCEICGRKTCGWTRVACIVGGIITYPYTGCFDCLTNREKEWKQMIEKHARGY